jgi:hypothetical protein
MAALRTAAQRGSDPAGIIGGVRVGEATRNCDRNQRAGERGHSPHRPARLPSPWRSIHVGHRVSSARVTRRVVLETGSELRSALHRAGRAGNVDSHPAVRTRPPRHRRPICPRRIGDPGPPISVDPETVVRNFSFRPREAGNTACADRQCAGGDCVAQPRRGRCGCPVDHRTLTPERMRPCAADHGHQPRRCSEILRPARFPGVACRIQTRPHRHLTTTERGAVRIRAGLTPLVADQRKSLPTIRVLSDRIDAGCLTRGKIPISVGVSVQDEAQAHPHSCSFRWPQPGPAAYTTPADDAAVADAAPRLPMKADIRGRAPHRHRSGITAVDGPLAQPGSRFPVVLTCFACDGRRVEARTLICRMPA